MSRAAAAAGLLLLLHAGSRHDGRGWVEGSVTNSAADFLGSLTAPEPSEFRLRPDLVHELPYDIDHTLLLAPPDLPEDLQHPYVTRVDFRLAESSAKRWIDDENLLGASPFYHGSALPSIDPLMRASPFKGRDGPLPTPRQPFLTSTAPLSLGHNFNLRQTHHSAIDTPLEAEYGDIGAFMKEADNRLGIGDRARPVGFAHDFAQLPNPFDAFKLKSFDPSKSRVAQAMRSRVDDDLVHADDRGSVANAGDISLLQPGVDMSNGATFAGRDDANAFQPGNDYGVDKFTMALRCVEDPLTMQHARAAHISKHNPSTDLTLQPVVTGGVCIGFRCSDGVVIAADTMLSQGSFQRFLDARRLHKISDTIVMAADGEYADFQEMQMMFQEYTEEYDAIEPQGVYRVYPSQAFHFLHRVMYAKRCKMDPFWNSVLLGGYDLRASLELPVHGEQDRGPEPFLGMVDMHGTPYESHILATGFGSYMALPLMRLATREAERLNNGTMPKALTIAEATQWATDVMRVLSLRSSQCSNRIQIASVGEDGVNITAPFEVEGNWEIDGFFSGDTGRGNKYQPNATVEDLWPY